TRTAPLSSSWTMAWRDAPGVFVYAASSASSSAVTRVPLSIPFSRSMSRTASRISWLMSQPFVNQIRPHDLVVRDVHLALGPGGDGHRRLVAGVRLPPKPPPPLNLPGRPYPAPPALTPRKVRTLPNGRPAPRREASP